MLEQWFKAGTESLTGAGLKTPVISMAMIRLMASHTQHRVLTGRSWMVWWLQ
jgi:hypothetical protein